MKRFLSFIILLLIAIIVLAFTVKNAGDVSFNFYVGSITLPLSLLLALTLISGAILGVLASLSVVLRTKRELRKAAKQVRMKVQEVENLRAIPFQDKS